MSKLLKKKLKNLRNDLKLEADWKQSQRALLLTRIKSQVLDQPYKKENAITRIMKLNYQGFGRQLMAGGSVALAVILGIFASVSASSSLPGDFFYSMKITSEKIQVTLVSDPIQKADLQLNFAKRRVDEIKKVSASSKDSKNLKEPLDGYKKAIEDVKIAVAAAKKDNPKQAADLAKSLHAATLDFTKSIKSDVADVANDKEVSDTVKEVIATTKSAELDAVVLIAETGSTDEAKQVLGDYLDTLKEDITAQNTKDAEVKTASAAAVKADETALAAETAPAAETTTALTAEEITKAQASVDSGDIEAAVKIIKPSDETTAPADSSAPTTTDSTATPSNTNSNTNTNTNTNTNSNSTTNTNTP